MNPIKIAVIVLFLCVGLIVSLSFIVKTPISDKSAILDKSSSKEPIISKNPLIWMRNITSTEQVNQKEQSSLPVLDNLSDSFSKFTNEINLFTPTLPQLNQPTIQSPQLLQDDSEAVENYYKNFVEALNRANFTSEEVAMMTKSEDERPLLLEELIGKAVQGTDLNELRTSFNLWHQLDERVLIELNKLSVNPKTSSFHQTMVNWFSYHSKVAKQFSEENLSKNQINQLAQQFKKDAEIHMLKFKQSLEVSEVSKGLGKIFTSLIPQAKAFTCAALVPPPFYHFGGRVTLMMPCNFGIVETISPPCGGLLLFSYPVLAANPYLWKKPTIGSAVLGRSIVAPGVCPLGPCPLCSLFPYEAVVLYFGTSLLP